MSSLIKGVTVTMIFESGALNRGEKLSGSVTSLKKLARDSKEYPYMSREFIRHHLFDTLKTRFAYADAPVQTTGNGSNKIIQFAFPAANIVEYPEMDLFGFMTTEKPIATRKACLGITKAISLEAWGHGLAFGANHDLVRRARESGQDANPNPHTKEEHYGYFKVSFSLDLCRFGYSEIVWSDESKGKKEDKDSDQAQESEEEQKKPKKSKEQKETTLVDWFQQQEHKAEASEVQQKCCLIQPNSEASYDWRAMKQGENTIGYVGYTVKDKYQRLVFVVSDGERRKRLTELLEVLKSGIMLHSDTESYGIVPRFIVGAALKAPVPVLNSFIKLTKQGEVDQKTLEYGLKNDYIEQAWYDGILCDSLGNDSACTRGFNVPEIVAKALPQGEA